MLAHAEANRPLAVDDAGEVGASNLIHTFILSQSANKGTIKGVEPGKKGKK